MLSNITNVPPNAAPDFSEHNRLQAPASSGVGLTQHEMDVVNDLLLDIRNNFFQVPKEQRDLFLSDPNIKFILFAYERGILPANSALQLGIGQSAPSIRFSAAPGVPEVFISRQNVLNILEEFWRNNHYELFPSPIASDDPYDSAFPKPGFPDPIALPDNSLESASQTNTMPLDKVLNSGEYLESSNGRYRLYLHSDGNVVLRDWQDGDRDSLWSSGSHVKDVGDAKGVRLELLEGNLALYADTGSVIWSSGETGTDADKLILQDDGTLSLYAGDTAVWSVNEPSPPRTGVLTLDGAEVSYSVYSDVNKHKDEKNVSTDVSDGQTQFVSIGASDGGGSSKKDVPIDKELMEQQGFELLGVEGTKDKKVEIWARVFDSNTMNTTISVTGDAKDVAYVVHTLDKQLDVHSLTVEEDPAKMSGNTLKIDDGNGESLKLLAVFFDDSVEVKNPDENTEQHWGFGDGDGFFVGIWGENEDIPSKYKTENHAPGGKQYESLLVMS